MVKWVFRKLQTSVYPSNIAPIGAKLWQNAFHDGLQLSIFRRRKNFCRPNFKRPFTPPTWLQSGRNFVKARFRRFETFNVSTSQIFFGEKKLVQKYAFRHFRQILLGLDEFGRRNLNLWWILLQVHKFSAWYDPWRSDSCAVAFGHRVLGPGSRVQGPGSRVQGPGSRVQGPGSRVQGSGSRQASASQTGLGPHVGGGYSHLLKNIKW